MKKTLITLGIVGVILTGSSTFSGETTATTEFIDSTYQKNTQKEQIFDIPDDAISAKIKVNRDAWTDKGQGINVIEVVTEVWSDKTNWGNHCGFTADGGERYVQNEETKQSELASENYNDCFLYEGTNRKIRVTVKAKETLNTTASVEFTTPRLGFLSPKKAHAAVAHVQSSANGNVCVATSCAVSYPGNTTANNLLIHTCRYGTNGLTESVADAQTNTYTKAREEENSGDGNATLMVWWAIASGATTNSTTCTLSGSATMRVAVSEASGSHLTAPVDQTTGAEGSGTAISTGALTAANDGSLYFVAVDNFGAATYTAGTDFTLRSLVPVTSHRVGTETFAQTTAASHGGTMTQSVSQSWNSVLVIFKPPASAAGPTNPAILNVNGQINVGGEVRIGN